MRKNNNLKSKRKLLISIFVMVFVFSIFKVGINFAFSNLFVISNNEITTKSELAVVNSVDFDESNITSDLTFHKLGDYVTFKVKIKNEDEKNYIVKSVSDDNKNEYISYEYEDYTGTKINSGEEVVFEITEKYTKENTDISTRVQNFSANILVVLEDEEENVIEKEIPVAPVEELSENSTDEEKEDESEVTSPENIVVEDGKAEETEIVENKVQQENTIEPQQSEKNSIIEKLFINPKTGDSITVYIILSSISLIMIVLLSRKKEIILNSKESKGKHSEKSNNRFKLFGLILVGIAILPIASKSSTNNSFKIPFKNNIVLKDKLLVTYVVNNQSYEKVINYEGKVELENPEVQGYDFNNWLKDDGTIFDIEELVKDDITLTASFTPINYSISYDLEGGILENDNPATYTIESNDIELNNPTKVGYKFEGWTGTNLSDKTENVIIAKGSVGNREYISNWKANSYKIIFDNNTGSGTMSEQIMTYDISGNLNANTFTKTGYSFKCWNTKADGTGTAYEDQQEVLNLVENGEITLYAEWEAKDYVITFDKNDDNATGIMEAQSIKYDQSEKLKENTFEKAGYHLEEWNTKSDGTGTSYTDEQVVTNLGDKTLYAIWSEGVAEIDGVIYNTLQLAVDDVPTNNTETTIKLLCNISESVTVEKNKNIILNLQRYTINDDAGAIIITNRGTLKIYNGIMQTTSITHAVINNEKNGKLIISGGKIISTGDKQAVYNDGGDVEISGDAYLYSTSKIRATVQNNSGTMLVTGGTIISTKQHGIDNRNQNLIIGTKDNDVNKNSLVIQGKINGINSSGNFKFYDGIIKGGSSAINNESKVIEMEDGYSIIHSEEIIDGAKYYTAYLGIPCTITFDPNEGTVKESSRILASGEKIGSLPTPERSRHIFDGWFTELEGGEEVTPDTVISSDEILYAHWTRKFVAEMDGIKYDSLQEPINLVPSDNTQTIIKLIDDHSENVTVPKNKNIVFDFQDYTLSNSNKEEVIKNSGTIELISGTITSDGNAATINNYGGNVKISGGSVNSTGERQSICNYSGIIEITGDAYLCSTTVGNSSNLVLERGTISNSNKGEVIVTGGTIIALNQYAIGNEGKLIIGIQGDGQINSTTPNIRGNDVGIKSIGSLYYYDGIVKGIDVPIDGTVTEKEEDTEIIINTEEIEDKTYKTAYLGE